MLTTGTGKVGTGFKLNLPYHHCLVSSLICGTLLLDFIYHSSTESIALTGDRVAGRTNDGREELCDEGSIQKG